MHKPVEKLKDKDLELLADYVSRIRPAKEILAESGWKNPDFQ